MRFSVVIPVLNEEKLLEELLEQLSHKNLKEKFDYEVIVSDGGSEDNTLSIARKYADILLTHERGTPSNISIGRNKGARAAKGEILIFLNGDVTLSSKKEFFENIDVYFRHKDHTAMTFSVRIDPDEEMISDRIFLGFYNLYFRTLNLIGIGMGRGECQIVRKDIFEKIGGYNEAIAAGEDFDLFRRIRQIGRIKYAVKPVIYESPRRFRKYGHHRIFLSWLLNSLSVLITGKSISKEWEQVR